MPGEDRPEPREDRAAIPHWPVAVRAAMVITGLTLLLIVNVRHLVFYIAWGLIGLALASEVAATLTYAIRARRARHSGL